MILALTLPMSRAEPPTSWASRLGRLNGCMYVQDFVSDLGLSWPKITRGRSDELRKLSDIASGDPAAIERFAMKPGPGRTRLIGAEPIHSQMMSHQNLKLCPLCVQDALTTDGQLFWGAPVYCQLDLVRSCREHSVALVHLPPPTYPRCKYDLAGRIFDELPLLASAASDVVPQECSTLETYIISRVDDKIRCAPTWLDQLEIGVVSKACISLNEVVRAKEQLNGKRREPQNEAEVFEAIVGSRQALWKFLEYVWHLPTSQKSGFFVDFNRFARWLSQTEERPGTKPMLDLVRDFVETHYPIGGGEKVLGRVCKSRKVHSVMTISRQFGVDHTTLRRLFQGISARGGYSELPPPDAREQVLAKDYSAWLTKFAESINPKLAARQLGVKYEILIKLRDSGWITPIVSMEGLVDRYHPEELQRFLNDVLAGAMPVASQEPGQISFLASPMHCRCDSLDVLRLVHDGALKSVFRLKGRRGLSGLIVSKEEVLDALEGPPLDGFTKDELRSKWRVSSSTISHLVNSGFLRAKKTKHPRNRKLMHLVGPKEVLRFELEFCTLGCLSDEWKVHPIKLASDLAAQNVDSIELPKGLSRIYRRSDIAFIL